MLLFVQRFGTRNHAREYADNSGSYGSNNSSYHSHRSRTIDYGHGGTKPMPSSDDGHVKTDPWSRDQFTEQRHYSSERHHAADKPKFPPSQGEVDQPSKAVAVEKAMEMAQRTRDIISKLGFKHMSQQSEGSSSFTDSSLQPSTGYSVPEAQSLEADASTAKASTTVESAAINKIRQNTSLVKYAFNLPVETGSTTESAPSLPSHDVNTLWTDAERKYGSTYEAPVPQHSCESVNYAVADIPSYEGNTTAFSQQNAWNTAPNVIQEPVKTDSCDPTIANILKSIGFNFELSNMMQDKARKESSSSSVNQNSSAESSSRANRVPSIYEEQANRYRAEQMTQYGTPKTDDKEPLHLHGAVESSANKLPLHVMQQKHDDKPFGEDMFKESPAADFKLKFKTSDANAGQKSGTLYEDFSDSDDDFTATAKVDANIESTPNPALASQNIPNTSAFGNEGMLKQMTASKTADDIDWELNTEKFIRQLQQPRQPERTVTVVPKSESTGRSIAVPPLQREHIDDDISENQNENFKMSKSFVPLAELKTIRKTIIVSDSKSESGVGKSDFSSLGKNVKNSYASSSNREKTPKYQQRNEGPSKSTERANIDGSRKKKRLSDSDERGDVTASSSKVTKLDTNSADASKEKQKKIDALLRELENLRRQQNILMRRKKRDKDAHKDPFLMENSKLQEEICNQIDKLRKASQQTEDNNKSQTFDQVLYTKLLIWLFTLLAYEYCFISIGKHCNSI